MNLGRDVRAVHACLVLSTDPVLLATDDTGDIDVSGGRSRLASGIEAVKLGINNRFETTRGSLFWARSTGFPLNANEYTPESDAIFGDTFDRGKLASIISAHVLATPAVSRMMSFVDNFDGRTRTASPTWSALVVFDDIEPSSVPGTVALGVG